VNLAQLESVFVRGLMICGAIGTIILLLFLYWLVRPYDLLQVTGSAELVNVPADGTYAPGDTVEWQRPTICNYGTGTQSNVRWIEYETGTAFRMLDTQFPQPSGELPVCVTDNVTRYVIPNDAVRDGMWRFRTEISYDPNPVRTVTLTLYSPWFTVDHNTEGT
jgi:hypothetical protein